MDTSPCPPKTLDVSVESTRSVEVLTVPQPLEPYERGRTSVPGLGESLRATADLPLSPLRKTGPLATDIVP